VAAGQPDLQLADRLVVGQVRRGHVVGLPFQDIAPVFRGSEATAENSR
jgi:hypothetical protein